MNAPAGCYICSILAVRTCAICAEPTCRQHLMQDDWTSDWGCVKCIQPVIDSRRRAEQAEAAERKRRLASPESSFDELCERLRTMAPIEVLWPAKMAMVGKRHWRTGEPTQPAGTWTPNSTLGHGWFTGANWERKWVQPASRDGGFDMSEGHPILLMTDGSLLVTEPPFVNGDSQVRWVRLNADGHPLTAEEVGVSKLMILTQTWL